MVVTLVGIHTVDLTGNSVLEDVVTLAGILAVDLTGSSALDCFVDG